MKKSQFNLTHLHSTTLDMGYLVPFCLIDALPNDSFRISLSSFIRAQPMLAPLMHEVKLYTQYWYVPYRLLWDNWEAFITGGNDGMEAPPYPIIKAPAGGFTTGSLADYFGLPIGQPEIEVSAMPFRAMVEIWNTRYRDEDLQDELAISYADGLDTTTSTALLSPSWKRDYFTTSRASTQRGAEISVPINSDITSEVVVNIGISVTAKAYSVSNWQAPTDIGGDANLAWTACYVANPVFTLDSGDTYSFSGDFMGQYRNPDENGHGIIKFGRCSGKITFESVTELPDQNTPYVLKGFTSTKTNDYKVAPSLVFDSANVIPTGTKRVSSAGALDIRSLRVASALQRYQERSLKWGNRYEEFIQREFGIKPRDSRIQRPEYLGGSSGVLQISEVLQTAEGTDTGVGTMRGHGVAGLKQRAIRFTCPEHGLILGLLSIRPKPVYTQGIDRAWLRRSKLDFFLPELAGIGMQEVFTQEIYATKDNKGLIFGYQDRYNEYRTIKPRVTGEFRTSELSYWNLARHFSQAPYLNNNFINMGLSAETFKRPFAVQNKHAFLAMIRNNIKAWRPIPKVAKNILK